MDKSNNERLFKRDFKSNSILLCGNSLLIPTVLIFSLYLSIITRVSLSCCIELYCVVLKLVHN